MVDISRRLFLGGAIAVVAAAVVSRPADAVPRIVGDGVHDDAAGLNALFNGMPVQIDNECVQAMDGVIALSAGHFLIGSPITVTRRRDIIVSGGFFEARGDFTGRGVIELEGCERTTWQDMVIDCAQARGARAAFACT